MIRASILALLLASCATAPAEEAKPLTLYQTCKEVPPAPPPPPAPRSIAQLVAWSTRLVTAYNAAVDARNDCAAKLLKNPVVKE